MQRVIAQSAVRNFTSCARALAAPRMSQLIPDVAGELEAIHPHLPRQARISRLDALKERFSDALADRWNRLERAGGADDDVEGASARTEPLLLGALQTVLREGPRLLGLYDAQQTRDETPQMKPEWAQALQRESADTLHWLLDQGLVGANVAATYGACMHPSLRDAFLGDGWRSARTQGAMQGDTLSRMVENRTRGANGAGLSMACMLALRLYAHPKSSVFNLVRACADLHRLFPGGSVARCVDEIPTLVHEAVCSLHDMPDARVWGTLYKGMQSRLGGTWQVGEEISIDRPFSVTTIEHQSYAGRIVHGTPYDQELELTDSNELRTKAVLIAAFHPVATAPEGEAVILPGQVFRIQGSQVREEPVREGGSHAIVRLRAEKVDKRPMDPPGGG